MADTRLPRVGRRCSRERGSRRRYVEDYLGDYPWEYSEEVPDSEGIRMLRTRDAFPDIPPLYVYYRVEEQPNKIIYLGLSRAWSQEESF